MPNFFTSRAHGRKKRAGSFLSRAEDEAEQRRQAPSDDEGPPPGDIF
jgi:hypothetical protein